MLDRALAKLTAAAGRPLVAVGVALTTVALASGLRAWTGAMLAQPPTYPAFYLAVMGTALVAGVWAGMLALGLSALVVWWFWLPQLHVFNFDSSQGLNLVTFVITAALMALVCGTLRRATGRSLAAEARYRALVDSGSTIVWRTDAEGSLFEEAGWSAYTGQDEKEALRHGYLKMIHPQDVERTKAVQRAIGTTRSGYEIEYRLHHGASGGWRWVLGRGVPLVDAQGKVFEWAGVITDVHDQREAEDALRASEARLRGLAEDLEARVTQRTAELKASLEERARAEAALAQSQRLETVGRLTGGVAHDFNNLLTVIIGGLDMILRAPENTDRVKRLAEAAMESGRRGERLTRQLLAFSRRQELKLEAVDLQALIERAEPLLRRAAPQSVTLIFRNDPDAGWATLDSAQFEAALLNLVVNAADAVGEDGNITIETGRATLAVGEVAEAKAGPHVVVSVIDDGAGMTPEVLAQVFEPFFTTKDVGKGTGLGLAQVYGFVRQCGGGVKIESAPGVGTTVSLYLPAIPAQARRPDDGPAAGIGAPFGRGRTVLLAEDDAAVCMVTEGLLLEFGCKVLTAPDGRQALARLKAEPDIALLLSDIIMPGGMTGVDLAREAAALRPELSIVLATGYAGERLEGVEDAGWPVLRKPYRVEDLALAVREGLERRPAPRIERP